MFTNLKNDYFLGLKCLFTIIFIPFITYYNLLTYYYYHNIISSISITTIIFFFTIIIFSIIPYWARKTLFLLTYIWLLSLCIISRQRLSSNSLPTYIQTHTQTHTYTHTHTHILKDEKVKSWESKQTVNRYYHFKPVYQKLWSYDVWLG